MRADVAPFLLTALFSFSGLGLLTALGFVNPSLGGVFAALGLAYLAGVGTVLLLAIVLLTVGVPVRLPATVALSALVGLAGLGLAAHRGEPLRPFLKPASRPRRLSGIDELLAAVFIAGLAVLAVLGFRHAAVLPLDDWDAWSLWTRKAIALLAWGELRPEFFASSAYGFSHLDYPLVVPLYEAVYFRAAGTVDTQALHVQFWTLLVAFIWAAAFIAARVSRAAIWVPIVAAVALAPGVYDQLLTLYADVPVAIFLCIGLLLLGLWLAGGRTPDLALGALFLAVAANTKNEGLMAGVVALVVLALIVVVQPSPGVGRLRAIRPVAIALAGFVAAVLPWRVWLEAHEISGDLPVGDGLEPSFLADRFDRVWPSVEALTRELVLSDRWFYVVPLALAVAAICLAVGVLRRVAAFYVITGVAVFALFTWAYWISSNELGWHLGTSVGRVASSLVFVGVAALLQLTGALERLAPRGEVADHELEAERQAAPERSAR